MGEWTRFEDKWPDLGESCEYVIEVRCEGEFNGPKDGEPSITPNNEVEPVGTFAKWRKKLV